MFGNNRYRGTKKSLLLGWLIALCIYVYGLARAAYSKADPCVKSLFLMKRKDGRARDNCYLIKDLWHKGRVWWKSRGEIGAGQCCGMFTEKQCIGPCVQKGGTGPVNYGQHQTSTIRIHVVSTLIPLPSAHISIAHRPTSWRAGCSPFTNHGNFLSFILSFFHSSQTGPHQWQ